MEEILNLLKENARLTVEDMAAMTKKTPEEVTSIIKKFEDSGVILKYSAIVNPEKDFEAKKKSVRRFSSSAATARTWFDALADRIYRFPQVKSLYLMSGGYDFKIIIEGDSQKKSHFCFGKTFNT